VRDHKGKTPHNLVYRPQAVDRIPNSVASAIALSSSIRIAYCMTDIIGDMHAYAKVSVLRCLCNASARSQARLTAKILSAVSSVVCTPFSRYSGDL